MVDLGQLNLTTFLDIMSEFEERCTKHAGIRLLSLSATIEMFVVA